MCWSPGSRASPTAPRRKSSTASSSSSTATNCRPPTIDDDFYHADLIGLEARLTDGTVIGKVTAVPNFGAGDLIEVRDPRSGDTYLYPFTSAAVPHIHLKDGFLVIDPPTEAELGEEEPD